MIDADGFRLNVGIIIANDNNCVFWGKRIKQNSWQFPQGGVNDGESTEDTLFRELWEEVGIEQQDVSILGSTRRWLRYKIPKRMIRNEKPVCIGQKQKWFLLKLHGDKICLNSTKKPEFDGWDWVSYWFPLRGVVSFKRDVYRRALKELAPLFFDTSLYGGRTQPLNHLLEG